LAVNVGPVHFPKSPSAVTLHDRQCPSRTSLKPTGLAGLREGRSEQGITMRPWFIMFGTGLALIGLQAVQAQVTIDIRKINCKQFLGGEVTDARTLGIWLNGYVNGARGKTLIEPLSAGHISLEHYCEDHIDALVLDAARNVFGADK
jgi:hypothetical protein